MVVLIFFCVENVINLNLEDLEVLGIFEILVLIIFFFLENKFLSICLVIVFVRFFIYIL